MYPLATRIAACRGWTAAALLATLALPLPAHGQPEATTQRDSTRFTLDPVIVTAPAPSMPLTFVTDPRKPRQPVPAADGADYLKTIPGFAAIRNGGANGDPVLRGMFGSRIQILTDGSAMLGACPARMDAPCSYVSPETFDRLTVVRGPQTVQWGPGASAGTVMFERLPPAYATTTARVGPGIMGGSWGRNDETLDVTGGEPGGFARIVAVRSHQDDYSDGDGQKVPSSWNKWSADGVVGYTPTEATRLELNVGAGDGQARYAGRGMDGAQFLRRVAGLKLTQTMHAGALSEIAAQVAYMDADHVMDNYTLRQPDPMSAMPMPMAAQVARRTLDDRLAATFRWERELQLVAGFDHQYNYHRQRSAMGVGAYENVPWSRDAQFANVGGFAEATWNASPGSQLVGGFRLDLPAVTDQRDSVGSMMVMANPTANVRRTETLPSGFARYVRFLGARTTAYAGLGHSERMPDYWELFSPDRGPEGSMNAFSAIRPEKTTQLDVGVQSGDEHLGGWLSAYAGTVRDFILFTYMSGGMMGTTSQVSNVDATIRGGEAGLTLETLPHLRFEASLAYAWGENRAEDQPLPQMPPFEGRFALVFDAGGDWSAGALVRAAATQDRVALDEGNVVGRDLGPTPGFAILSFNVAHRLPIGMTLAAGVDNLLDRTYSEHLNLAGDSAFGYPADPVRIHEPGRTVWIKLNVRP